MTNQQKIVLVIGYLALIYLMLQGLLHTIINLLELEI